MNRPGPEIDFLTRPFAETDFLTCSGLERDFMFALVRKLLFLVHCPDSDTDFLLAPVQNYFFDSPWFEIYFFFTRRGSETDLVLNPSSC